MIGMLAFFKESTDNRERAIFSCMIVMLFSEFKLFAHFSKRILKIYAVFTGSLIKNQLVTDHSLVLCKMSWIHCASLLIQRCFI
uniref:Putative ovule protein n=1 Tax=Solanum chacoense TaxID=4108 RepID=A0A0V0H004_SOLCH